MPKQVKYTEASEVFTIPSAITTPVPAEVIGNVHNEPQVQLDPTVMAAAVRFIEQGAKFENQLRKQVISSAAIMCAQGREFGKAKRVLRNSGANDKLVQEVIDELYMKSGLAPSTMNRRAQMWEMAVNREIIDLELQLKIEKSPTLTSEILAEMEARIGSITGTQFMRQMGVLPDKEKKAQADKTVKSLKERLDGKSVKVQSLLVEILEEVNSQTIDEVLKSVVCEIVNSLEKAFIKFQTTLAGKVPDLRTGTSVDEVALAAINPAEELATV